MTMQADVTLQVKRALYIISAIPALVSVVTGTLGGNDDGMLILVATPYFLWLVLFASFIWLSFLEVAKTSKFVLTCIWHLLCVGATMTFFSSLHTGDSNTLFLWMPIGTQIGILVAVGLQDCASMISWRKVRGLLLSTLVGLQVLMGAEEELLPIYERGRRSPLPYEWNTPQTLSSTATSVATYQRMAITPVNDSDNNP